MSYDYGLLYYEVRNRRTTEPENVFVVHVAGQGSRGILFSYRSRAWKFNPQAVQVNMVDDTDQAEGLITRVPRSRAEDVASLIGQVLPSESELLRMSNEGAAAEYGEPPVTAPG